MKIAVHAFPMNIVQEIEIAEKRIRSNILQTPLVESRELSKLISGKVFLKMESEQYTGSFKARGSLNKMLSLIEKGDTKGVITASTGNHALGCARALELTQLKGTIYMPENAVSSKVKALENYQAELSFYGNNSLETELYAKAQAEQWGRTWVSPYDDPEVIGGQGTIGFELCRQMEKMDHVLACVGGGGLISGIGSYVKAKSPNTKVIACLPENSPEMALSIKEGEVVSLDAYKETLSDGSAGGLEPDAITFPICQKVVDECLLATEDEIAAEIRFMAHTHKKIIEGAAAVPIACLRKHANTFKGSTVVIIICGGNIDIEKLKNIL